MAIGIGAANVWIGLAGEVRAPFVSADVYVAEECPPCSPVRKAFQSVPGANIKSIDDPVYRRQLQELQGDDAVMLPATVIHHEDGTKVLLDTVPEMVAAATLAGERAAAGRRRVKVGLALLAAVCASILLSPSAAFLGDLWPALIGYVGVLLVILECQTCGGAATKLAPPALLGMSYAAICLLCGKWAFARRAVIPVLSITALVVQGAWQLLTPTLCLGCMVVTFSLLTILWTLFREHLGVAAWRSGGATVALVIGLSALAGLAVDRSRPTSTTLLGGDLVGKPVQSFIRSPLLGADRGRHVFVITIPGCQACTTVAADLAALRIPHRISRLCYGSNVPTDCWQAGVPPGGFPVLLLVDDDGIIRDWTTGWSDDPTIRRLLLENLNTKLKEEMQ